MEFVFETEYGREAFTAMARGLRKTVRKKQSKRSHIFCSIVMILALLFTIPLGDKTFTLDFKTVVNLLLVLVLLLVLIFEDRFNGYTARKRMLKGTEKAKTVFRDDDYESETEMGKTEWSYGKIKALAETEDYLVFVFSENHAQVYDKSGLTGGTIEEFKAFIQNKTKKEIISVE